MRDKKFWKKGIIGILCVALAFALAGCGQAKPEDTVKKGLDAMIAGDFDAAFTCFDGETKSTLAEDEPEAEELSKLMFSKMAYSIQDVKAEQDTAVVKTEIKALDMETVLQNVMTDVMAAALTNPDMSQEEIETQTMEKLSEQIRQTTDTKATTVDVELKLVDGNWQIQGTEELLEALTGGMTSLSGDLMDIA